MADRARSGDERWRCFVGVPIGDEVREAIAGFVTDLRRSPWADDWRWTDPETWHITLAFLGSIPPAAIPAIASSLEAVAARHAAFSVSTGGLGAFPSMRRARVLWYGVDDPEGKLAALAADVRSAVQIDTDPPLRAHITLARAGKRLSALGSSAPALPGSRDDAVADISITQVRLMRSRLGMTPRHTPLAVAQLTRHPLPGRDGPAHDGFS
jgi:2'-5' RNA ligase